jgi:peptidoglycan/LPS O-acetylase OafA/YrhL
MRHAGLYHSSHLENSVSEQASQLHSGNPGKILFADQLRAVAVACVMIVHLLGVYWKFRDVVAGHIFAPPITGPSARSLDLITSNYFNYGPFGVALFFLISGFVIPFSLAKSTRPRFLAARMLRIYPTYVVCLLLGVLTAWLSSRYWGVPFGWTWPKILQNALLVNNLTGMESVDMVNWSLAIEIKFYLLSCLLAAFIVHARVLPLLSVSLLLTAVIVAADYHLSAQWGSIDAFGISIYLSQLAHDMTFMPFMFIGTLFSYHFRGQLSTRELAVAALVLFAVFIEAWLHTVLRAQFPLVPLNYLYALLVFTAAYAWRERFKPWRAVGFAASISYPLYALHSLLGYAAIRFLNSHGVTYYLAVLLAVGGIAAVAYLVHCLVEMPTQQWGKSLMRARVAVQDAAPVAAEAG